MLSSLTSKPAYIRSGQRLQHKVYNGKEEAWMQDGTDVCFTIFIFTFMASRYRIDDVMPT